MAPLLKDRSASFWPSKSNRAQPFFPVGGGSSFSAGSCFLLATAWTGSMDAGTPFCSTVLSAFAVSKAPWSLLGSIRLNSSETDWVCWVWEECSISSLSKECMLAIFLSVQVNSALACLCCCFFCCCLSSSSAARFSFCCSVNSWSICIQSRVPLTEATFPR